MSDNPIQTFSGSEIDVHFDSRLCMHVGECVRATGALFESGRTPWCEPDQLRREEVRAIVERCPSGALTYTDKNGAPEPVPAENCIAVAPDGPLYATGELVIEGAPEDMPGIRTRAALCRCGASNNKPFCDDSHRAAGFRDGGAVGDPGPGLSARGGPLELKPVASGPLLAKGYFAIRAGTGRLAWQGEKAGLCRCGASQNKPFCDGAHRGIGFTG